MGGPGSKNKIPDKRNGIKGTSRRKQHRSDKKSKKEKRSRQKEGMIEESSHAEETRVEARYMRESSTLEDDAKDLEQMGEEFKKKSARFEAKFKKSSLREQMRFTANTYNIFAPKYIIYMNLTGHHGSMMEIVDLRGRNLRFPLIDVSGGPGVMMEYIFNKFILSVLIRQIGNDLSREKDPNAFSLIALNALTDEMDTRPTTELPIIPEGKPLIVINDFSKGMIQIAKKRFRDLAENICSRLKGKPKKDLREQVYRLFYENIEFKTHAIEDLPSVYGDNYFASACCFQTAHITPNKEAVFNAICRILRPGGTLLSIEEFPFRISTTMGFEYIMSRLHATVDPIEDKVTFQKMVEAASEHHTKDGKPALQTLRYVDASEVRVWVKDKRHPAKKHPIYGFEFEKEGDLYLPKKPKFWTP